MPWNFSWMPWIFDKESALSLENEKFYALIYTIICIKAVFTAPVCIFMQRENQAGASMYRLDGFCAILRVNAESENVKTLQRE